MQAATYFEGRRGVYPYPVVWCGRDAGADATVTEAGAIMFLLPWAHLEALEDVRMTSWFKSGEKKGCSAAVDFALKAVTTSSLDLADEAMRITRGPIGVCMAWQCKLFPHGHTLHITV